MDKRLTGPALVAYLRDNPTSDAMRAAADEIERLRAALVAILEHDSPINIVDTATATERDIFDIASAALAQGQEEA